MSAIKMDFLLFTLQLDDTNERFNQGVQGILLVVLPKRRLSSSIATRE